MVLSCKAGQVGWENNTGDQSRFEIQTEDTLLLEKYVLIWLFSKARVWILGLRRAGELLHDSTTSCLASNFLI